MFNLCDGIVGSGPAAPGQLGEREVFDGVPRRFIKASGFTN